MIINGTATDETLRGTDGDDSIQGFGGNDTLIAGDGDDLLSGGTGFDDFILDPVSTGSNSGDVITDFEAGDSIRIGEFVHFSIREPFDFLSFIGTAAFSSVAGETRYSTGSGETLVEVDFDGDGSADYSVTLTNGEFALRQTEDRFIGLEVDVAFGGAPTVGNDTIGGTAAADTIDGLSGDDDLRGAAGADELFGGNGNDTLKGGAGNDILEGGADDDQIHSSIGFDTVDGGTGTDRLIVNRDGQIGLTITDTMVSDSVSGETIDITSIESVAVSQRTAGNFDDTIDGSASTMQVFLFGGGGDDIIRGGDGDDGAIEGDSGRDTLSGGLGADIFGFDLLYEFDATGDTILDFEPGDIIDFRALELAFTALGDPDGVVVDFIGSAAFSGSIGEMRYLHSGTNTIVELDSDGDGTGDHRITLTNGVFELFDGDSSDFEALQILVDASATNNADSLVGSNGADILSAKSGADTLYGLAGNDNLRGDNGDDQIFGGLGLDTINGGDGDDLVFGGDDDDKLFGKDGRDTLYGDDGNDKLFGGGDNDRLFGGEGSDSLFGNANADIQNGENGDDAFRGYGGNDRLNGGAGNDSLLGHTGRDIIHGNGDNDILDAGEADDQLFGDDGNDTLFGRDGNDLLEGGAGNDLLTGNLGVDTLNGGLGDDTLVGNGGNDVFIFALGDGNDTINAFTQGPGVRDVIQLSGFGTAFDTFAEIFAAATDDGFGNTMIDFGGGDTITLMGDEKADLDADDFVFV